MKNPLMKRIPRDLKQNAGRYIGMFVLLAATIMFGSSFLSVMESIKYTVNNNAEECNVEDGEFETVNEIDKDSYNTITKKLENEGIKLYKNYYVSINSYEETDKILIFGYRDEVNTPSVFEGSLPDNEDEIAIDRLYAKNNNINVGDIINLDDVKFTVSGTISFPDYTGLFKSNQDMVMNTTDFGVSVTTTNGLERYNKGKYTYRYSYTLADSGLSTKESREQAEKIQKILLANKIELQSFVMSQDNQSISYLSDDMGSDGPMMKFIIYIMVVIIAFVFAVLTNNTIESEAGIIGTLRASGYKKSEIIAHYSMPTVIIAIVGSIVGNVLGYTVMIAPFKSIYYTSYCIAPFIEVFSKEAFIETTVIPVVLMILINVLMLANKLTISPLRFLRKDIKKGKQKKAVKLPDFKFIRRFHIRVILQNMGNYLVLFVGIIFASFLLMFGEGLMPLMKHYVDGVSAAVPYEYQYIIKTPVEIDGADKQTVYSLNTYYKQGKIDIPVSFMGNSLDGQFFKDVELPDSEDEIVITSPLSKKLGINKGDTVTFKDDYYDIEYKLKVVDIYDYDGTLGAFMSRKNLNKMLDKPADYYNCYLSNDKLDIDNNNIVKFVTRGDITNATDQMMTSLNGMISMIAVFAVVVYIVIMYILTKTVIDKNALQISLMKVLGYEDKEIGKLYINATTITVFISLVATIPLGIAAFKASLVVVSVKLEGYLPFYLPNWIYFMIVIVGMIIYWIVSRIHLRKIKKIPMNMALKNVE